MLEQNISTVTVYISGKISYAAETHSSGQEVLTSIELTDKYKTAIKYNM